MKRCELMFQTSWDKFSTLTLIKSLCTTKSIRNLSRYGSIRKNFLQFRINQPWRMLKDSNSWKEIQESMANLYKLTLTQISLMEVRLILSSPIPMIINLHQIIGIIRLEEITLITLDMAMGTLLTEKSQTTLLVIIMEDLQQQINLLELTASLSLTLGQTLILQNSHKSITEWKLQATSDL